MPDNNEMPGKNDSSDLPLDDSGINNDHILDLCDFIINSAWEKCITTKDYNKNISIKELKDLAQTLTFVWSLVQEIIDLDQTLRFMDDDFPGMTDEEDDED